MTIQNPHIPRLRAVPSIGPAAAVDDQPAYEGTPCGGCQRLTEVGESITKYRRRWWHLSCANRDADAGNPDEAWLALAHDLARSPRAYTTREARAIVGRLISMTEAGRLAHLEREAADLIQQFPLLDGCFDHPAETVAMGNDLAALERRSIRGDADADHELDVLYNQLRQQQLAADR